MEMWAELVLVFCVVSLHRCKVTEHDTAEHNIAPGVIIRATVREVDKSLLPFFCFEVRHNRQVKKGEFYVIVLNVFIINSLFFFLALQ